MRKLVSISVLLLFTFLISNSCKKDNKNDESAKFEVVNIHTNHGNILLWLYDETPLHKSNFDSLAKKGFFDGLIFHRVIKDFVIQGGDPLGTGSGGPGYTIKAEIQNGLTHKYGAVGAARDNNPQKRSNGSQFYIVNNKSGTHSLDGDYTVFGETIDGFDVIDEIANVATNSNDKPLTDVIMTKVEVVEFTAEELISNYGFTIPE